MYFAELEELRYDAGLSIKAYCEKLHISERTYFRWKKIGICPKWAGIVTKCLTGDLEAIGWKHWYIKNGVLYNRQLWCGYNREPKDLLTPLFCKNNQYNQMDRATNDDHQRQLEAI